MTKRTVDAMKPPRSGEAWLWDSEVRGFGVRARGTVRTYVLRYAAPGRPGASRWLTIGTHGRPWRPDPATGHGRVLTADLAREEAIRLLGAKADGRDPAELRDGALTMPTLQAFAERYVLEHAQARKAASSHRGDRGMLDRHILPAMGKERLDHVGAAQVVKLHNALRSTPFAANRCLSLLSHVFTKARQWGVLPPGYANPCADVQRFPERKRKRYLTGEERLRVGAALASSKASVYALAAIRVLALTGARPDEILRLRREQLAGKVDQAGKTGERPIYFDKHALEIIASLPAVPGNPWVFASRNHGKHLMPTALSHVWSEIARAASVPDVRLYDLRHTFASVAVDRGLSLPIIGELLGHKRGETTARYAHLSDHPVRAASDEVAEEIAKALRGDR